MFQTIWLMSTKMVDLEKKLNNIITCLFCFLQLFDFCKKAVA